MNAERARRILSLVWYTTAWGDISCSRRGGVVDSARFDGELIGIDGVGNRDVSGCLL